MRRIISLRISGGTYRWRWHYKLMPAMEGEKVSGTMPYYLTPKQDDFNQNPRPLITNDRYWPLAVCHDAGCADF